VREDVKKSGKAQTVLGLISSEELGPTLTHEHLLLDMRCWFVEPKTARESALAAEPVSLKNLGWVRYHYSSSLDNLQLLDEEVAARELQLFKEAGGGTLVELTSIGLGRSPLGLARISRASGVHVVMGTGYYVTGLPGMCTDGIWAEDRLVSEMVRDIEIGVEDSGIRAGIIGEVGVEWPLREADRTSLRAAARAQQETGAAINVHPGRSPDSPFEIADLLGAAGADLHRVVMSHVDRTLFDHESQITLAQRGCYLSLDQFSIEGWSPFRMVKSERTTEPADIPTDAARVDQIRALVEAGLVDRILVSHDHCHKHRLFSYGGPGYAHILTNVIPLMRARGLSEGDMSTILVENPRRLLQFT